MEHLFRAMLTDREEQGIAAFYKEEGIREGKQEGIKEGMEAERKTNISRLLAFGMSPENISKALQVPLETVLAIKG